MQKQPLKVSLVIPIKNETDSLFALIASINKQTFAPAEIVLVDGGSTDGTVELAEKLTRDDLRYRVIEAGKASPGRGRNIGVENAQNHWIAFTDAGIRLSDDWLEKLVKAVNKNPEPDIIYGAYSPMLNTTFEKCAALAYVPGKPRNQIRGKFIASCLLKKKVWETVGGFPDRRAAEDLMFMEAAEKHGFNVAYAPEAMVYWYLRPDLISTFQKFVLYSKHNVWAGRQWDWHYGILKQYLLVSPFIILAFLHDWWWLSVVAGWLCARTIKRILPHRHEYGLSPLYNPVYFFSVMFLILTIDFATFTGWVQATLDGN